MFDVYESIEDGYLWNFSPSEQKRFRRQHRARQKNFNGYQSKLLKLLTTEDPAIFANYDPSPSTPFEIKYTFNRIYMNDPREKELTLDFLDPPAPKKAPYAETITWAFEDNTFCQRVILNGIQMWEGWHTRGFNDPEAAQVLDALSSKKLSEFTFSSYPLLTDKTYQQIADIIMRPDNHWQHVTLGKIPVNEMIADMYKKSGKVSFTRIIKPVKTAHCSFFSFLNLGYTHERS